MSYIKDMYVDLVDDYNDIKGEKRKLKYNNTILNKKNKDLTSQLDMIRNMNNGLKENMDEIYNQVAELYDLIDDENIEKYEILEKLAEIQNLTK